MNNGKVAIEQRVKEGEGKVKVREGRGYSIKPSRYRRTMKHSQPSPPSCVRVSAAGDAVKANH